MSTMKNKKVFFILYFTSCIFQLTSYNLYADGLSTTFGDITIEDVKLGYTYTIKPLEITNTGTQSANIKIEIIQPSPENLKAGYELIPDTGWITLEKDYFPGVLTGTTIQTNVVVTIPDSLLYLGRKYQVCFRLYTETDEQKVPDAGINSRLLLNISNVSEKKVEKQSLKNEEKLIFIKYLYDKTKFNKEVWDIEKELTVDLKERLSKKFTVVGSTDKKIKDKIYTIAGEITKFDLGSNEFSSLPLAYYREYSAEIDMELELIYPSGKTEKLHSGKKENYKKLRTIIPGPTEEELIDDKITDFNTREEIEWGSEEFNKSIIGKAVTAVIEDLVEQIKTKLIEE